MTQCSCRCSANILVFHKCVPQYTCRAHISHFTQRLNGLLTHIAISIFYCNKQCLHCPLIFQIAQKTRSDLSLIIIALHHPAAPMHHQLVCPIFLSPVGNNRVETLQCAEPNDCPVIAQYIILHQIALKSPHSHLDLWPRTPICINLRQSKKDSPAHLLIAQQICQRPNRPGRSNASQSHCRNPAHLGYFTLRLQTQNSDHSRIPNLTQRIDGRQPQYRHLLLHDSDQCIHRSRIPNLTQRIYRRQCQNSPLVLQKRNE